MTTVFTQLKHIFLVLVIICVLICGMGAGLCAPTSSAYAASAQTLSALSSAQARYAEACEYLDYLYQLVYEAQNAYDATTYQLELTNAAIAELQVQIEQEKIELAEAQDILAARISADYRAGNVEFWDIILSATSFEDLVSRIYYAGKVSDADAEAIQAVKDIKAQLEASEAALQEQRRQQEVLLAQQAEELEALNAQTAQAASYVESLDAEVRALYAQAQAEAQAAAEAAWAAAQAEAAAQAAAAIEAAESQGYYYNESSSSWTDSSGSAVSADVVADATGYNVSSILERAYSLINTSYSELDCSGFTAAAYGGELISWSYAQYENVLSTGSYTTDLNSLNVGDLVFYSYDGGETTYHVALYIGNGQVIDSIPNGGVQVRDIDYCDGVIGGGTPSTA